MAIKPEDFFKNVISHCKEYGYIFQSSEIYDGLSAVYDYGQNGAELKKNIRDYWWKAMVQLHDNIVGIDASIFMHPTTWKASGHVDAFNDPLIDNKDSKKRYRADVLIEEHVAKIEDKLEKEVEKAKKRFENFDEAMFRSTNARVLEYQTKINDINNRFKTALNAGDLAAVKQLILDLEIVCPISGTKNWTDVRQFNLMFSTKYGAASDAPPIDKNQRVLYNLFKSGKKQISQNELLSDGFDPNKGSNDSGRYYLAPTNDVKAALEHNPTFLIHEDEADIIYLRPETAQGIFVNYLNVQKTGRMKLPFGIAQTGKAFRNEIVARQFIFRMREFEQMEMQFFVKPGTEMQYYDEWKTKRLNWHLSLGLGKEHYKFHDHLKLAHYANAACDIEFQFPFGFKELEGIHSRTDYDLKQHEQFSGKKLQYFDVEKNESYVPYVVETSVGLDRLFLSILSSALKEETLEGGDTRTVLSLPPALAPIKVAVFPLVKKDGLPELAEKIINTLKFDFNVTYDEKDTVGKRYRRQDAIGTPFCVTVDHKSLEDNTVTVRNRDTMLQERMNITTLYTFLEERVSIKSLLKSL